MFLTANKLADPVISPYTTTPILALYQVFIMKFQVPESSSPISSQSLPVTPAAPKKRKSISPSSALSSMAPRSSRKKRRTDLVSSSQESSEHTLVDIPAEIEKTGTEKTSDIENVSIEQIQEPESRQKDKVTDVLSRGVELSNADLFWITENLPSCGLRLLKLGEAQPDLRKEEAIIAYIHKLDGVPDQWLTGKIDLSRQQVTEYGMPYVDEIDILATILDMLSKGNANIDLNPNHWTIMRMAYHDDIADAEQIDDSAMFAILTYLRTAFDMSHVHKIDAYRFGWFLLCYFQDNVEVGSLELHMEKEIAQKLKDLKTQRTKYRNPAIVKLRIMDIRHQMYEDHAVQINDLCVLADRMRYAAAKKAFVVRNSNNLRNKEADIKELGHQYADADCPDKELFEKWPREARAKFVPLLATKQVLETQAHRSRTLFLGLRNYKKRLDPYVGQLRKDVERCEAEGVAFVSEIRDEWELARMKFCGIGSLPLQ